MAGSHCTISCNPVPHPHTHQSHQLPTLLPTACPRQAGWLLKNMTSGCPRFTGSTPAKQNSSAQKWDSPVSISPATFHLPWPLKRMHSLKSPFGSTTPTNHFQETQTYRSSYLPKNKPPSFHLLLTKPEKVKSLSPSSEIPCQKPGSTFFCY